MATEKYFCFNEQGELKRMKGRIVRFLDNEDPTGSDKDAIRTSLEVSPDAAGLVQADIGTQPNEIPVNGMLGDMAYQSSDGVSVAKLEVTDKVDGNLGVNITPVGRLEVALTPTTSATTVNETADFADSAIISNSGSSNFGDRIPLVFNVGNSGANGISAAIVGEREASGWNSALSFWTNGVTSGPEGTDAIQEAMRIDSSGRVGIGTSSPGSYNADANDLVVGAAGTGNRGLTIASGSANYGVIYFADGTTGNQQYRGAISYNHNTDALSLGTVGATRWYINSSGDLVANGAHGIDFGSTSSGSGNTVTSGLLDDYEEGLHTVTLTPQVSGTITLNSASNTIAYTKVGRMVTLTGQMGVTSVSSPSGDYVELSIPFVIGNYQHDAGSFASQIFLMNAASSIGSYSLIGIENESFLRIYKTTSTGVSGSNAASDFSGNEAIYFSCTYQTNT